MTLSLSASAKSNISPRLRFTNGMFWSSVSDPVTRSNQTRHFVHHRDNIVGVEVAESVEIVRIEAFERHLWRKARQRIAGNRQRPDERRAVGQRRFEGDRPGDRGVSRRGGECGGSPTCPGAR